MSNVLAALFGGLGAGASSYGSQRIREQDQERVAAQRMAELQQQEQARINAVKEQAAAAQALKQQQREAGVNSIRSLYPDFKAPEGDFDPQVVLKGMIDRETTNRTNTVQQGSMDRLERTLGGRMDQIAAQGDISKAIAAMGNDTRKTIATMMENGRNQRDLTPNPKTAPTVQDFYAKFLGQNDEDGMPMTPEKAMANAQRAFQVLTGGQQSARAPQQGNPAEGELALKAQQKIQNIMTDPSLSPEDKQDMVQQVNDILRARLSGMRGGR